MQVQTIEQLIRSVNGVTAEQDQALRAYLERLGVDAQAIPTAIAADAIQSLGLAGSGLAVAKPEALAKPKQKRSGGKLTKAQLEARLAEAEQQLAAVPVRPVAGTAGAGAQVQELALGALQNYFAIGEQAIEQIATARATYDANFLVRLEAATAVKQQQLGIEDPTAAVLDSYQTAANETIAKVAELINRSNEELGIAGKGFDVEYQP